MTAPDQPDVPPVGSSQSPRSRFRPGVASREALSIIGMVLVIKFVLFSFGYLSFETITDRRVLSIDAFLRIWVNWDAHHYLTLAEHGYQATGPIRNLLPFFPLYPWLIRLVAFPVGNYVVAAFIVTTIASLAVAVLFYFLARLDFTCERSFNAVWFLFIFPTSYFLHIPYTESLFIALSLASFLAARQGKWAIAGIIGAFAALTRFNGIVLIPALAVEALLQYQSDRKLNLQWLWILVVLLGLDAYLFLNLRVTGEAFTFVEIQRQNFNRVSDWPWDGIRATVNSLAWRGPTDRQLVAVEELIFISLGLVGTIATFWKLRLSYGVWMLGNWALASAYSFIFAAPRYTLVMFPLYLLFAMLSERRGWRTVITMWSLLFLGLFTTLYVRGGWAF